MADGITRIAVEGFKSIAKRQEIEIRPLTILAGANSSGKSSIMQPLLMLKQTLEASYDPGPLKIDGPNAKFTSSEQFLSRVNGGHGLLSISLDTEGLSLQVTFGKGESGIEILEQKETYPNGSVRVLRPEMTKDEIQDAFDQETPWARLFRERCFLHWGIAQGMPMNPFQLEFMLQAVIHVSGLRGNPGRTYQVTGVGPHYPGTFEHYVASVISNWQSRDHERYRALNRALEHIGLAERVESRNLNEAELELQVNRVPGGRLDDLVSIADVGFGVSQTLPVLVALQAANDAQLIYLEEPEIHLHPRAQTRLADVLADAAKRGVRVVAETHSSLLLRAIQTLVAKSMLDPALVQLHWFSRDRAGITQITSATPDENGAFGDWPEDFGDVALQSEKDYLDAVETKLAR